MKSKIVSIFNSLFSKKAYTFLISCFLVFFLIFPNFVIFTRTEVLTPFVFVIIMILILIDWSSLKFLKSKKTIYILTIIGLLLRVGIAIWFSKNMIQVSDFYDVFNRAKAFSFKTTYFQTAYHYMLYSIINGVAYKIFVAHQLVSFFVNILATSVAGIFLYLSTKRIFKNEAVANMAVILYTFWPSMLLYNTILSPDHYALLFMCISVYLFTVTYDVINDSNLKKKWWIVVLLGISISLLGFFKNFSPAMLMALFIIIILMIMINKKIWKSSIVTFLIVIFSFFTSNSIIFAVEEHIIGEKIIRNQFWQYAYVGLGLNNSGLYSAERYGEFSDYFYSHNKDIKKTDAHFAKKLKKEIKENLAAYPNLLIYKTNSSFGADNAQLYWITASLDAYKLESGANMLFNTLIIPINEIYYIILCLFVLGGVFYNVIYLKNNKLLFVNIAVFGFCMMLLFVESQGRYKYAFEPLLCILAVVGIYYGKDFIKKLLHIESKEELKK